MADFLREQTTKDSEEMTEEQEVQQKSPSINSFIWDLIKVVAVAFGIMLVFRFFIAEPFIVSGVSMLPTYENHQYLIINKLGYRVSDPQRGDVIVFKYPKDPKQYFIKRIIGLPGEKVRIDGGRVYIYNSEHLDGHVLPESYLPNQTVTYGTSETVTLGSNEYYVLGDNRGQSSDSRVWGILPKEDIVGEVLLRVLPITNFGLVPQASY